ncbi:MAG: tetratricopeptide repeat protein, partial [Planctomycetota bacterium]|nr:tetratricopeptide repeat protein [Planctomycetota bacterium]
IPSSVLDLVQARLADLEHDDKDLLDLAACCGFEFDPGLLAEALGERRLPLLKQLARIERTHFLVRSAGRAYVFDHHQVQEALYGALPELLREEYHALLAEALETRAGGPQADPEQLDGGVALDLCEHFLLGRRGERGLRYLDPALSHLRKGSHNDGAVQLLDVALAAPGLLTGDRRVALLLHKRGCLDALGRRAAEEEALDEALALVEQGGNRRLHAMVHAHYGSHYERISRDAEAVLQLEAGLAIADELDDAALQAQCTRALGVVHMYVGRYEEARAQLERSVRVCVDNRNDWGAAAARQNLGVVKWYLGHYLDAQHDFAKQLRYFQDEGYKEHEAIATANLGFMLSELGQQELALEHLKKALRVMREVGNRTVEGIVLEWMAHVVERQRDWPKAHALFKESLELRRQIRDESRSAESLVGLARMEHVLENDDLAVEHLDEAVRLAEETNHPSPVVMALTHRACAEGGDVQAAIDAVSKLENRLRFRERILAHYMLWRATKDREHLGTAHSLLLYLRDSAPECYRDDMIANVPLHKDVEAKWSASP